MKTLILVRHAKSDWDDPTLDDHDRPLNRRGEKDAPRMGKLLKKLDLVPDLVVSSTATRAKMTAEALAAETDYEIEKIIFKSRLYLPAVDKMLEIVRGLPEGKKKVILVAHNPGITTFLAKITGNYQSVPEMPTCAVAVLEMEGEWEKSATGTFMLRQFLTPRKDLQ